MGLKSGGWMSRVVAQTMELETSDGLIVILFLFLILVYLGLNIDEATHCVASVTALEGI
jgi:hypothetical protein